MSKTCFVIMPIGDQEYGSIKVTAGELKARYNDLIREALLVADSTLQVIRADEVSGPGVISTDIITRIMHSDYVIADVSYPNPNVFYELGLRHACRVGTIIIREKNAPRIPFDISHLRYIDYENTPSGLKQLSVDFKKYLGYFEQNPNWTDSQFQDLAKLMKYRFPDYSDPEDAIPPEAMAMMALMQAPEVLELFVRKGQGEEIDQMELLRVVAKNPQLAGAMVMALSKAGQLSFDKQEPALKQPSKLSRSQRRKKK